MPLGSPCEFLLKALGGGLGWPWVCPERHRNSQAVLGVALGGPQGALIYKQDPWVCSGILLVPGTLFLNKAVPGQRL